MVRIWHFHCRGPGSIPGWETEIPKAVWPKKRKKKTHTQKTKFISHNSGGWKSKIKVPAGLVSDETVCLACRELPSLSVLTRAFSLCAHIFGVSFFFWPHCMACRILVPWPGIEPCPLQWKCRVLTTGLPGNSLVSLFLKGHQSYWITAPPLWPHLTLITPLKALALNKGTLGIRASTYEFGWVGAQFSP